jgi:hydroxyquinol 1,2-dioxygenase
MYDVQYQQLTHPRARSVFRTDAQGRFRFRSVLPVAYPIPTDGPVGRMLMATGRHPWRPAHVHFMIEAPAHETLITHVFRDGDPYLDSDVVFGVRSSLIA